MKVANLIMSGLLILPSPTAVKFGANSILTSSLTFKRESQPAQMSPPVVHRPHSLHMTALQTNRTNSWPTFMREINSFDVSLHDNR